MRRQWRGDNYKLPLFKVFPPSMLCVRSEDCVGRHLNIAVADISNVRLISRWDAHDNETITVLGFLGLRSLHRQMKK